MGNSGPTIVCRLGQQGTGTASDSSSHRGARQPILIPRKPERYPHCWRPHVPTMQRQHSLCSIRWIRPTLPLVNSLAMQMTCVAVLPRPAVAAGTPGHLQHERRSRVLFCTGADRQRARTCGVWRTTPHSCFSGPANCRRGAARPTACLMTGTQIASSVVRTCSRHRIQVSVS